jgi:hypothetical protein
MDNIVQATTDYEDFLRKYIELLDDDLTLKHIRMRENKFAFFRATYYRWAQLFPSVLPNLMDAPRITAVGDLHVENFGTFRSPKGELEWGINDFDEADILPYTNDIVRLAASVLFAIGENKLAIRPEKACKAILKGYAKRINKRTRKAFILQKRKEHFLTKLVKNSFDDDESFWRHILNAPYIDYRNLPLAATDLLNMVIGSEDVFFHDDNNNDENFDKYDEALVLHRRIAGLGSLGHRRIVAVTKKNNNPQKRTKNTRKAINDAYMAQELKELGPPASVWLMNTGGVGWDKNTLQLLQYSASLTRDPSRHTKENWLIRRVAPDCVKLELSMLPAKRDEEFLLEKMGAETANTHITAAHDKNTEAMHAILNHVEARSSDWLIKASKTMIKKITEDYQFLKEIKRKKIHSNDTKN